jgi:hypothetical protein
VGLGNVDYKTISFLRLDGIDVDVKVNLIDPFNLNENFLVLNVNKINSTKETKLFYWIGNKRWTLNEFIFFALNNNLCMKIKNKQNVELTSYGICDVEVNRVFNNIFDFKFN